MCCCVRCASSQPAKTTFKRKIRPGVGRPAAAGTAAARNHGGHRPPYDCPATLPMRDMLPPVLESMSRMSRMASMGSCVGWDEAQRIPALCATSRDSLRFIPACENHLQQKDAARRRTAYGRRDHRRPQPRRPQAALRLPSHPSHTRHAPPVLESMSRMASMASMGNTRKRMPMLAMLPRARKACHAWRACRAWAVRKEGKHRCPCGLVALGAARLAATVRESVRTALAD